jgi:hypothetical protein
MINVLEFSNLYSNVILSLMCSSETLFNVICGQIAHIHTHSYPLLIPFTFLYFCKSFILSFITPFILLSIIIIVLTCPLNRIYTAKDRIFLFVSWMLVMFGNFQSTIIIIIIEKALEWVFDTCPLSSFLLLSSIWCPYSRMISNTFSFYSSQ